MNKEIFNLDDFWRSINHDFQQYNHTHCIACSNARYHYAKLYASHLALTEEVEKLRELLLEIKARCDVDTYDKIRDTL